MTEQQKLTLSDLVYKLLERIAIKLEDGQRPDIPCCAKRGTSTSCRAGRQMSKPRRCCQAMSD